MAMTFCVYVRLTICIALDALAPNLHLLKSDLNDIFLHRFEGVCECIWYQHFLKVNLKEDSPLNVKFYYLNLFKMPLIYFDKVEWPDTFSYQWNKRHTLQPRRGGFGHKVFWTRPELLLLFLKRQKFEWINGIWKASATISGSFGWSEWSWLNAKSAHCQMQASDSRGLILGSHFKLTWFSMRFKTRKWKVTEPGGCVSGDEWQLFNWAEIGWLRVKSMREILQHRNRTRPQMTCFFCSNLHS